MAQDVNSSCNLPPDSVKIFDFLAKTEVTSSRFNQGGTTVLWAPPSVSLNMCHITATVPV